MIKAFATEAAAQDSGGHNIHEIWGLGLSEEESMAVAEIGHSIWDSTWIAEIPEYCENLAMAAPEKDKEPDAEIFVVPEEEETCPNCGGGLHQIGLGGRWNHRWVDSCDACGWNNDVGTSTAHVLATCKAHGLIKKGVPDHREGRVGVKEALQLNEDGFDPRFD